MNNDYDLKTERRERSIDNDQQQQTGQKRVSTEDRAEVQSRTPYPVTFHPNILPPTEFMALGMFPG